MTIVETVEWIKERDNFILSTHESPDADGLGAEFALATALIAIGKRVDIVNSGRYAKCYDFIDTEGIISSLQETSLLDSVIKNSIAILLDTNDIMYTGSVADKIILKSKEVLIIDHHEVKTDFNGAICSVVDSSSTCEIVYKIISAFDYTMDKDVASALFAGIVYDTGSFAYSKTGIGTFEAAVALMQHGVDPSNVYTALYESYDISVLLLRKKVMATLELYNDEQVAIQTMSSDMLKETGSDYENAEGFINTPLQAKSVEVSIFFKENEQGVLRCSMRSKGSVNVAQIAQNFNGGGHRRAAGFRSAHPLNIIKEKVLQLVTAALST